MVGFIDKKLRIIVAGSRGMTNRYIVYQWLDFLTKNHDPIDIVILNGMAAGPDSFGGDWGKSRGVDVWELPADWDNLDALPCKIGINRWGKKYNKLAGINRNHDMGDKATHLVVFNLGVFGTSGSNDMKAYGEKVGLVVKEVIVLEDEL